METISHPKSLNKISYKTKNFFFEIKNMNLFSETKFDSDEPLSENTHFPYYGNLFEEKSLELPKFTSWEETDISSSNNFSKNKIFDISKEKKTKRVGRKRMREQNGGVKSHTKYDQDNVIRKIQVDFYKFLVCFINDILKNFGTNEKFLKISYEYIKKVKKENIELFKSTEIGKILSQKISTKYRKIFQDGEDKNNKLYLEVTKIDKIKRILSETSIKIFRDYYYKNKKDLSIYDLNIKISNKVKTYKHLLENNRKDALYIKKLEEIVDKFYLPKTKFVLNKKNKCLLL